MRLWRTRWAITTKQLEAAAQENVSDKKWVGFITQILTEEHRPGTPKFFSPEEVAQIVALACETPPASERPVTHGRACQFAEEAVKRDIALKISMNWKFKDN